MYPPYGNSQKRGLLRPNSSSHSGPVFRNFPLFGFLAGLVIFFYVFYIYQAQNSEMALLREQNEYQKKIASKLKTDHVDFQVQLEKYKETEQSLQNDKTKTEEKFYQCQREVDNERETVANLKKDVEKLTVAKEQCDAKLEQHLNQVETLTNIVADLRKKLNEQAPDSANPAETSNFGNSVPKSKKIAQDKSVHVDLRPGLNEVLSKNKIGSNNVIQHDNENVVVLHAHHNAVAISDVAHTPLSNREKADGPERPVGPGDRVKLEEKNERGNDGKPFVAGGDYDAEDTAVIQQPNESGFEKDQKEKKLDVEI